MDNIVISFPDNNCVMCGAQIPDGTMYCSTCKSKVELEESHKAQRQFAYDEACKRLYYGVGAKGYKSAFKDVLPEKELREIWQKAFMYMAEGAANEFKQSY